MRNNLLILSSIVIVVLAFVVVYLVMTPEDAREDMGMVGVPGDAPHLPAVMGYLDGEEVYFVHPEASAPEVAGMLTEMMGGSPVLVVPALEDVPESALAIVYVFANGVEGDGPLGFQVDVFNNPPGTEGYSPLRALVFLRELEGGKSLAQLSVPRALRLVRGVLLGPSREVLVHDAHQELYSLGRAEAPLELSAVLHSRREGARLLEDGPGDAR